MPIMRYRGVRGLGADATGTTTVYTILGIPWYYSVGAVGALLAYWFLFRKKTI